MARVTGGTVADRNAAFVGEIPGNYHRYLGPIFFHGYADDLAARLPVAAGMRVLETACGTGIVTRRLADRIVTDAQSQRQNLGIGARRSWNSTFESG
jgi:2-polyprenyl-3-methyl-5-hydroxy-6-metoxy-1,4-benzoquinol methylase